MKYPKLVALSLIAVPAFALAASEPPETAAPRESCSNIEWSTAFLKEYPKAPAACREVTVRDGMKYARFNGKVSKVGANFVQVEVSDVANTPISTIAFRVGAGGRITIGDKLERVSDLRVGDPLTFWVREGQFGISPTLTDRPMPIIKPEAMATD